MTWSSPFASRIESFLELRRAIGRRYEAAEAELHRFDRYVAGLEKPPDRMTGELVRDWLSAKPHVRPATQRSRVGIFRQFCLYLQRLDSRSYVPARALFPIRLPVFKAHIYTEDEMRALLRAALALSPLRWRLQPMTVYTMLLVLYGTGLRAGEVCRLRVGDVDLDARALFVRKTKFFKSRLVPFSSDLGDPLRSYLEARAACAPANATAPFFVNRLRRPYAPRPLSATFHRLVAIAGIADTSARRGPRLHDVRHTFAVTRVLCWYREGADVQAKLPLLSTYLGHGSILSTHVYLTATAEMFQAAGKRFESAFGSLIDAPEEAGHVQ